jgi:hypothetical protein
MIMAEPTKSGPDFDIDGAGRGPRAGKPNADVKKGTAEDIAAAEEQSIGRPPNSGKMAQESGPAVSPPGFDNGKAALRGH